MCPWDRTIFAEAAAAALWSQESTTLQICWDFYFTEGRKRKITSWTPSCLDEVWAVLSQYSLWERHGSGLQMGRVYEWVWMRGRKANISGTSWPSERSSSKACQTLWDKKSFTFPAIGGEGRSHHKNMSKKDFSKYTDKMVALTSRLHWRPSREPWLTVFYSKCWISVQKSSWTNIKTIWCGSFGGNWN